MKTEHHMLHLVLLVALLFSAASLNAKDGRYGKWKEQSREQKTEAGSKQESDDTKEQNMLKTQLEVRVSDVNGGPIEGARVMVVFSNEGETERSTNRRGIARLSNLPQGRVDVDVTSPGRISASKSTTLNETRMSLRFTLQPRPPPED